MIKTTLVALAVLVTATGAHAQTLPPQGQTPSPALGGRLPPPPPRLRGPMLDVSLEAVEAAMAACSAKGYKTTVLIVDTEGVPVAMLTADGAAARTQAIAASKAAVSLRYKVPSGVIAGRVMQEPALAAEVIADPKIRSVRRGAVPLFANGELIGAFAVSGAPGGDLDEPCIKAGMDKVGSRWK